MQTCSCWQWGLQRRPLWEQGSICLVPNPCTAQLSPAVKLVKHLGKGKIPRQREEEDVTKDWGTIEGTPRWEEEEEEGRYYTLDIRVQGYNRGYGCGDSLGTRAAIHCKLGSELGRDTEGTKTRGESILDQCRGVIRKRREELLHIDPPLLTRPVSLLGCVQELGVKDQSWAWETGEESCFAFNSHYPKLF